MVSDYIKKLLKDKARLKKWKRIGAINLDGVR